MKLVVLTKKGMRKLIHTGEEPNYKQDYLQLDGTPFCSECETELPVEEVIEEEVVEEVVEEPVEAPKPKKKKKATKKSTKK